MMAHEAKGACKITIVATELRVKKEVVTEYFLENLKNVRINSYLKYPITRVEMRYKNHTANLSILQYPKIVSNAPFKNE